MTNKQAQDALRQRYVEVIKKALADFIRMKANAHAEKYIDRYKKVAYDSYLAGMEAMSEIMED